MKMAFTLAITAVTAFAGISGVASSAEPVHSVTGSGSFFSWNRYFLDSVSINAWTDEEGNAFGTISWEETEVFGPLAGPGFTGYPWLIEVTSLEVVDNIAWIQGVVIASPQVPGDVGFVEDFFVVDNGNGQSGTSDVLKFGSGYPTPVDIGNFNVK